VEDVMWTQVDYQLGYWRGLSRAAALVRARIDEAARRDGLQNTPWVLLRRDHEPLASQAEEAYRDLADEAERARLQFLRLSLCAEAADAAATQRTGTGAASGSGPTCSHSDAEPGTR
jgi:hypothetical protein